MKPALLIIVLLSLSLGWLCVTDAAHHVQHNKQVLVINDFAVPVAIPVSPYGGYAYQQNVKSPAPPPDSLEDRIAAKVLAGLQGGTVSALKVNPYQLFIAHCATCHAKGDEDKGKPQMVSLSALVESEDSDLIDDCMEALLNDTMPKGAKLSPEVNGGLLKEFVAAKKEIKARKKVKAAAEAPPVPSP